jgi:hypothetical protein
MGFGNLLTSGPSKSPYMHNKNRGRETKDLRLEKEDPFKASTFTFNITGFKADKCARPQEIPRKLSF